jgi:Transposase, Mutator family
LVAKSSAHRVASEFQPRGVQSKKDQHDDSLFGFNQFGAAARGKIHFETLSGHPSHEHGSNEADGRQSRMHAGADRRDARGQEETCGFQVGVRGSAQSWRELLVKAKRRGLEIAPEIAVGDGALGFGKALDEIFITDAGCTRRRTC